tara:strand:- start:393 stop:731 length:339 start_codon:yes stop_codon:yes gene_type:complete
MKLKSFVLIVYLFFTNEVCSKEFKLICHNEQKINNSNLSERFSKIINFDNKTVENISGNYFDKILVFNKYELVMQNEIFETTSSFNLVDNRWTVFNEKFIDTYQCKKKGVIK